MLSTLLAIGLAFLLGSFPSGVVLARLATGRDIRQFGSGNPGAANAGRIGGWKIGVAVGFLDILKGLLAVLMGRWLGLGVGSLALVALAAVAGHDFSLFLRFRGGKGVATTLGVMLALTPLATVLGSATWLIAWLVSGYSSVASLAALALLPIYVGFTGQPPIDVVLASALFVLSAVLHRPNIIRLLRGTELGRGRRSASGG